MHALPHWECSRMGLEPHPTKAGSERNVGDVKLCQWDQDRPCLVKAYAFQLLASVHTHSLGHL